MVNGKKEKYIFSAIISRLKKEKESISTSFFIFFQKVIIKIITDLYKDFHF